MDIAVRRVGHVTIIFVLPMAPEEAVGLVSDGPAYKRLADAISSEIEGGHVKLVLNLKHVRFLASKVVGALLVARRRVVQVGGDLRIMWVITRTTEGLHCRAALGDLPI